MSPLFQNKNYLQVQFKKTLLPSSCWFDEWFFPKDTLNFSTRSNSHSLESAQICWTPACGPLWPNLQIEEKQALICAVLFALGAYFVSTFVRTNFACLEIFFKLRLLPTLSKLCRSDSIYARIDRKFNFSFDKHSAFKFQHALFFYSEFIENLCLPIYDTLRPLIIKVQHLETLSEMCSILRIEMLQEQTNNNRKNQILWNK